MSDDADLHLMVGEIRTDVKWLKDRYKSVDDIDKRLRKQERKTSWIMGAGLVIAAVCAKLGMPDVTSGLWH